jgi:hypothetical protein
VQIDCELPPGHDGWHYGEDDDGRLWRWSPTEDTDDE